MTGRAQSVGVELGVWQRNILRERVARTFRRAEILGLHDVLRARAAEFSDVVASVAPHWLVEARAQSAAAETEAWQLLAINCLPANFWGKRNREYLAPPLETVGDESDLIDVYDAQGVEAGEGGGDCTSFFALGGATLSGDAILHKNRDERDEVQWCGIRQNEEGFRWAGTGDIGNIGAAWVQTENEWAGANNSGSVVVEGEWLDGKLSDAHALRFFAETCARLEEIPAAVESLVAAEVLGGGGPNGSNIWLFCSAERALVIEATSRRFALRWFDESDAMDVRTNHFLLPEMQEFARAPHPSSVARLERASALWHPQNGIASISGSVELGRDRVGAPFAICRNTEDNLNSVTVSTATATLSAIDPRRCQSHLRNGHPMFCPAVILCPVDTVCDSELVSGAHNNRWRRERDKS
ncbi:MAG TPA: carcinine hydrolase/isopenicillin-N N-acyltransferase family protein [Abditibacteriaceae bacterium]